MTKLKRFFLYIRLIDDTGLSLTNIGGLIVLAKVSQSLFTPNQPLSLVELGSFMAVLGSFHWDSRQKSRQPQVNQVDAK